VIKEAKAKSLSRKHKKVDSWILARYERTYIVAAHEIAPIVMSLLTDIMWMPSLERI